MKMRNRVIAILISFALLIGLMPGMSMTVYARDNLVGTAIRLNQTIVFEMSYVKKTSDTVTDELYGWYTLKDFYYNDVDGMWEFKHVGRYDDLVFSILGDKNSQPIGYWISGGDGETVETAYELSLLYEYPLWIDDIQVSNANAGDILGDGTASFDLGTNTLTLKGARITEGEEREGRSVCIYASGFDLTISLEGENSIGSSVVMDAIAVDQKDGQGGSLTIEGDGTLNASGKQYALYAKKDMKITGGNVNAKIAGASGKNAVRADLGIEISGQNTEVKASTSGAMQDAVSAGTVLSINGGKVSAETKGDGSSAISGPAGVMLNGGETIAYASGQTQTVGSDMYFPYGISSPNGNIIIGATAKLTAAGNEAALYVDEEKNTKVITEASGSGWTDYEGTENETGISASEDAKVLGFKKVCLPAPQKGVIYLEASYDTSTDEVTYTEKTAPAFTVVTSETEVLGEDGKETWYVVRGDVTFPEKIVVNGTVHLIICDGAKLTAKKGIVVLKGDYDATLNIYTQSSGDNMGELEAIGAKNCAGIGCDESGAACGTINIHGGKITATGGANAAGIGGGSGKNGGDVEIYGGIVTAIGGHFGAGIGGGDSGSGGTVTIRGGTVIATGGDYGAGIGKGDGDYPSGSLNLGGGVKMFISSDNSKWSQYDSLSDTRERYMRTDKSHEHDFKYTAEGATVTATCSSDCPLPEHKATLTIAAPKHKTYNDGKDPKAIISQTHSIRGDAKVKYFKATADDNRGDELTDAPTNAGKYWAEITIGQGSNTATAHVIYNIEKAVHPASVTTEAVVKTGGVITLSDNVILPDDATGSAKYRIYGDSKGCTLNDGVIFAGYTEGTVTVEVIVGEDANYKASQPKMITVTITTKDTQKIETANVEATYGETGKKVSATATGGGAISYAVKKGSRIYIDVDETTGDLTIKKAGTAYVTVTAAETADHAKAIKDVKITISKLPNPMSYVETQKVEQTFSRYYQALFLAGAEDAAGDVNYEIIREKSDDEIVNYCTLDGRKLTVDADAPGGTYTLVIRAKAEGNDIYASAEKESIVTLQLNKNNSLEKDPEARTLKYNGQAQELVTAGKAAGGDMVYALGENDTDPPASDKWSESIPKGTEEGTYYVWFKVRGDSKHFDSEPECIVVKIAEADPPPIVESIITFDLNGGSLDGKTGIVTLKEKNGTVITLPAPIRDGYTFDYWEGSKYYAGDQYTVNGDHTLKAVWKTATNGGSNSDGKSSSNKSAETGDENALSTWIVLLIAALIGTTGMVVALGGSLYERRP